MARQLSELVEEIKSWFESYLDSREYQYVQGDTCEIPDEELYCCWNIYVQDNVTDARIGLQRVYFVFHPDNTALSGILVYTDIVKPLKVDDSNVFTKWETSIKTELICDHLGSQMPSEVYKTQLIETLEHNRMILKGTMRM